MKKLLFALLLLPFITKAQVKTKLYVGGPLATNVYRGPLGSDSALYIMAGCDSPANINVSGFYSVYRGALIYKDTCNDAIYTSNPDASWTRIINSSGDIYIDGDTIVINNIKVVNKLRIPLTDTTNARKGCGNIIYDTINEHYYGDVCINGVHYAWQCFDCISGSGTISEITATNNYAQTWTITNPSGPTTNLSLVLDTTLLSTRANVDSKTITLTQGSNISITGNATQNLGQNPSWTINATGFGTGTVTSVGLAAPTIFTVTGSPVTTSGTLTFAPNNVQGDIIYGSAANTLSYLNKSTTLGHVLTNTGTNNNPAWDFPILLTTTGTSGAATYTGRTLNIPQYSTSAALTTNAIGYGIAGVLGGTVDSLSYVPTTRTATLVNSLVDGSTGINQLGWYLKNNGLATTTVTSLYSPSIGFTTTARKTNATAETRYAAWAIKVKGNTGATNISSQMEFSYINGSNSTPIDPTTASTIAFWSDGNLYSSQNLYTNGTAGNGTVFASTYDASTTSGTSLSFIASNASNSAITTAFAGQQVSKFFQATKNVSFQNGGTIPADAADGGQFNIYQQSGMTGIGTVTGTGGTANLSAGTTTTNFINQVKPGDQIAIAAPNAETLTVQSVTSATALVFTGNMANNHTNAGFTITPATTRKFTVYNNGNSLQNGKPQYDATITAGGTTGNRTIDKPSGTVNIAASGTTVTVTNSLCTTSSIVFAVIRTNDATAQIKSVVPGAGSFVINIVASTGEVSIGWLVIN